MELKWERPNVEKLIVLIQEKELLYSTKTREYLDRTKKALAYNQIKEKLEISMVGVTVEDIKKKWKSLRSQYVREKGLIQCSKKSGSGVHDIYVPKLWCFEELKFLETHTTARKSVDNVEMPSTSSSSPMFACDDNNNDEPTPKRPKKSNQFAELHSKFASLKETIRNKKQTLKYSSLGSLVATQMEDISPEYKQDAAWEIQSVLKKYIDKSRQQIPAASSDLTQLPDYIGESCTAPSDLTQLPLNTNEDCQQPKKDLLQMSMDGIFDESDFDV